MEDQHAKVPRRSKRSAYLPAVLMLGTLSQISQVLLLRELLMVFHGNELSMGLILAAWLFWVGVGSFLAPVLLQRFPCSLLLLMMGGAPVLILPTTLLFIRGLRGLFPAPPGTYLSLLDMGLASFLATAPTGLLLGIFFILLTRVLREQDRERDTSRAHKTYMGEAVGNMLGGILFTFILVKHLHALQSALLIALFMLAATLLLYRDLERRPERLPPKIYPFLLGIMIAAVLCLPLFEHIDNWGYKIQWQQFSPQHQLVQVHQSKHGTISVLERNDQYSFFQSGHHIFSTAGPTAEAHGLEEQEAAAFAHLAMVQHQDPQDILLVGGSLRGTLGEIIKYPLQRIDIVELDEVLTKAAWPYVSSSTKKTLTDPRVTTIHMDGRLFIKETEKKYDLIIIDIPDPTTAALNRFYTREFFQEAKNSLHPQGVLVIGSLSTPDLRSLGVANRNTSIFHTLSQVFPYVLPAGEHFLFYFASLCPHQITVHVPTLSQRFKEQQIVTDGFSHHHYSVLLQESLVRRVHWILQHHGRSPTAHLEGPAFGPLLPGSIDQQLKEIKELSPVQERYFINSDFQPIGYYYTLMFWSDLTRSGGGETLKRLLHVKEWWLLPLLLLPLLGILSLRKRSTRERRTIYGFVYEMVGLVVAVFMSGLALGTFLTHRLIQVKESMKTLATVQLIMALYAVSMAFLLPKTATLPSSSSILSLFFLLTFLAGFINGVDFPLAAACCMAQKKEPEKAAGTVYGVELLGACTGATLCSFLVVPIFGITACCLLAAVVSITAFLGLYLTGGVHWWKRKKVSPVAGETC